MNEKTTRLVTAKSVRAGHPDKFCDQVADAILDAHLRLDPNARVAVEVFATAGKIVVGGEITSQAKVDCSLGSDNHLVAQTSFLKNLAEHFLGMVPAIHRGNVEEIDPVGNRGMDNFAGIVIVTAVPVATEIPAADRQSRDLILDKTNFLVDHDKHSFSFRRMA